MILAGASLVGPGALAGQEPSPPAVDDPEAYRVYATLLSTHWPGGAPWTVWTPTAELVIHRETSTSDCRFARGKRIDRTGSVVTVNGRPLTPDERLTLLAVPLPDSTWQPVLDAYLAAQPTVRTVLPGQELGFPYKLT